MDTTSNFLSWSRPTHPTTCTSSSATKPNAPLPFKSTDSSLATVVNGFLYLRDGLTPEQRETIRLREERKQILHARMVNAESYKAWYTAARELDTLEGNDLWKDDAGSGEYNPELLEERLRQLDDARDQADIRAMMHLVRTSLSRDLGGMDNIDLYRHCHCGTKKLIENYVSSALRTIAALVEQGATSLQADEEWGPKDLLDAMLFARQSFGRSALLLSGGGTFGMSHIGVIKAMFEARLLPRIVSGASAGSIVCAVICTRTDDEMPQLMKDFPYGDLAVFDEEGNEDTILDHVFRLFTKGNWSDIKHLTRVMQDMLGDMTFQEAYNRTRRICNITVSSASIYELPRLLNYVTAPNVMIWSAVAASCSVPLVFSAAHLLVKDPVTGEHSLWDSTPQMWIDGSVDNDLPMTRLAEMFNVNHFIVSQVNPHVAPFLAREDAHGHGDGKSPQQPDSTGDSDWLYSVTALAKGEALHRMQLMGEMGIFTNFVSKLQAMLSQKYSGDINIFPAVGVFDLPRILKNPTPSFMERMGLLGERGTWPLLSRIRDRCAIEIALDNAVHALRARVVFSKSQVDLRRAFTSNYDGVRRGSHDPVGPSRLALPRIDTMPPKEKLAVRRAKRQSGNAVVAGGLKFHGSDLINDNPYKVTDEDTDEEERLEMAMHSHGRKMTRPRRLPRNYLIPTLKLSPVQTRPPQAGFARDVAADHPQSAILPPKSFYHDSLAQSLQSSRTLHAAMHSKSNGTPDIVVDDTASMTSPQTNPRRRGETGVDTSDVQTSEDDDEYDDEYDDDDVDAQNRESPVVPPVSPVRSRADSLFGTAWLEDHGRAGNGRKDSVSVFRQSRSSSTALPEVALSPVDEGTSTTPSRGDISPSSGA
ncbi:acyl transferase/acyl hydrolase/lysophospholipase [Microdochium trichocladiopsis]|uniref:Patatin-like phospholipase domain-containing protein n=1 Tax=Microdochium trichocladiopsis TaxID=1682393 RepID=A0A9P8XUL1_9PEZI|nr:acyl transferase/acyl hydrolase/lysophospholipase [Microdochium trichocladiopsis]KAH7018383.1 acyl transferase/acyl hydrolase/lysophospholipase [Microdochium trichocladiopsis]